MKNCHNIHHRHSIRLKGYDYSQAGLYFITICTKDRECLFGEIVDGKMILNDSGKIADECWLEIPKHFPNTVLHEHIVMPNHVHGIIELIKIGSPNVGVQNFQPQRNEFQKIIPHSIGSIVRGFKTGVTKWFRNNSVGVQNFEPLQSPNESLSSNGVQNIEPQRPPNESLSLNGVQNIEPQQIWQRNYYEHIIKNEQSFQHIADYIIKNPENWNKDDFFNCH
jgi:REP element-mobilizing transposase RayT